MPGLKITALAGLMGALTLSACVSVLPEPATPDALYRIQAQADGPVLSSGLTIREPEAPRVFSGAAMVSEDASGALRLVPGVEWAGPATRQFQLALVDSFAQTGESAVLPESGVVTRYELSSRFKTFGFVDGDAVCDISLTLIETASRARVKSGAVRLSEPVLNRNPGARAQKLKTVAEQCVAGVSEFAALIESGP
jgi:cholesterol transport system auxiliary component